MAMAFIYMSPAQLKGQSITPEELADFMEKSFTHSAEGELNRKRLIELMNGKFVKRVYGDGDLDKLWQAAIWIIQSRDEYM
jgi:hypothetical protein